MNSINGELLRWPWYLLFLLLPIRLLAEPIAVHHHAGGGDRAAAQLIVEVDKKSVVLGEALSFEVNVVFDPQRFDLQGISLDERFKRAWHLDAVQGPEKKRDDHGSVVLVWHVRAIPLVVGRVALPVFDVDMLSNAEQGPGSFFRGFFFSRSVQRLKASEKMIDVTPIPCKGPCLGVGSYTKAHLSVDREKISQGDAIELTCRISGEGSVGFLEMLAPVLPAQATLHSSQVRRGDGFVDFSFVVQLMESGSITVPAQRIGLYDPVKKQGYTLYSNELTLSVEARAFNQGELSCGDDETSRAEADQDEPFIESSTIPREASFIRSIALPLWVLFLLVACIVFVAMGLRIYPFIRPYGVKIKRFYGWLISYLVITWRVYRKRATANELYLYFTRYPVQRFATQEDMSDWQVFWDQLLAERFSGAGSQDDNLSLKARIWLRRPQRYGPLLLVSLFVCIFHSVCCGEADKSLAKTVEKLRSSQMTSSWREFADIETSIRSFKAQNGGRAEGPHRWSDRTFWLVRAIHLLPFVIWQLLLVISLVALLWRPRIVYFLVVIVSSLATAVGYDERRSDRWLVLERETKVYLGPSKSYPTCCELPPLGEVRVKERSVSQGSRWLRVDCVGCSGWIASPESF